MQLSVHDTAYDKFKCGNNSAARQTAHENPFCLYAKACNIYQQVGESACKCHCPMRKASEGYFDSAVQYGTQTVNKRILFNFFQNHHLHIFLPEICTFFHRGNDFLKGRW